MSDKTISLIVSSEMYEAIQSESRRTGQSMSATVEGKLSLTLFAERESTIDRLREAMRSDHNVKNLVDDWRHQEVTERYWAAFGDPLEAMKA